MAWLKSRDLQSLSQIPINYLFFGLYFLFIASIHLYHVFLIEDQGSFARYFFLLYSFVECLIETLLLLLIANGIRLFFPRFGLIFYGVGVFFLLLTHLIDFPLVRFMDMSFWYALNFVAQLKWSTFIELLYASNVSMGVWLLSFAAGALLVISSICFFRITEKLSSKRPLVCSYALLATILCTFCLFLFTWEYTAHNYAVNVHFDRYEKTLPWKSTLFPEKKEHLALLTPLREPLGQAERFGKLDSQAFSLRRKPDIYLFIVESLREDFISERVAPNLYGFKRDNLSFDLALSNANATHISWFSIFYSQLPFYYGAAHLNEWKGGSLSLQILKKMGYKINVCTSARLAYFEMDRLIFGEGGHLAEAIYTFEEPEEDVPYLRDKKVMQKVAQCAAQSDSKGGHAYIVFLDATHHDYSWPAEMQPPFNPYEEKINYLKAAFTNSDVELIKNRYRNSLYYVDSLFGEFFSTLEKSPGGKEAVVVITGDHGEEFYEHGHLFHASSISHPQTHVPLYYKFGQDKTLRERAKCPMTCHMDIFPSVFHYLAGEDVMREAMQGQSIFTKERWPYTVIARFNASSSPSEFCIHNGESKLLLSFSDERDIFNSKGLKIISTKNQRDEIIPHNLHSIRENYGEALDRLFSP